MRDTVAVVIGTFGDRSVWAPLAERAIASIERQTRAPDDWVWSHGETLQQARNQGAELVDDCDWFIFLDADDELAPGYVEAMLAGDGDIRRPSTIGFYDDGTEDDAAVMIPERDLRTSNFIVIGAMCRERLFTAVGGFDDYPMLEDWVLWRKLVAAGATVGEVPAAVYRVGIRDGSRNTDTVLHGQTYARILQEVPL